MSEQRVTLLAALAALEQELRALSASQFRSMKKADVADESGAANAYEMAAESNLACANRVAALRVRFEGAETTLQARVWDWMDRALPGQRHDSTIRGLRFLEEAIELSQAVGVPPEEARALMKWVYERPRGHAPQEVGGVAITLAALCGSIGVDLNAAGEAEFERVNRPDVIEKIRRRQAEKNEVTRTAPGPDPEPWRERR